MNSVFLQRTNLNNNYTLLGKSIMKNYGVNISDNYYNNFLNISQQLSLQNKTMSTIELNKLSLLEILKQICNELELNKQEEQGQQGQQGQQGVCSLNNPGACETYVTNPNNAMNDSLNNINTVNNQNDIQKINYERELMDQRNTIIDRPQTASFKHYDDNKKTTNSRYDEMMKDRNHFNENKKPEVPDWLQAKNTNKQSEKPTQLPDFVKSKKTHDTIESTDEILNTMGETEELGGIGDDDEPGSLNEMFQESSLKEQMDNFDESAPVIMPGSYNPDEFKIDKSDTAPNFSGEDFSDKKNVNKIDENNEMFSANNEMFSANNEMFSANNEMFSANKEPVNDNFLNENNVTANNNMFPANKEPLNNSINENNVINDNNINDKLRNSESNNYSNISHIENKITKLESLLNKAILNNNNLIEKKETSLLLDSKNKIINNYLNFNLFQLNFNTGYTNIHSIQIVSGQIPASNYNVFSTNNKFHFVEVDNLYTIEIESGNYTIVKLIEIIQSEMNEISENQYSIEVSDITSKITISSNNDFALYFNLENSIGKYLGFTQDLYENNSVYKAEELTNISPDDYVNFCIENIETPNIIDNNKYCFGKLYFNDSTHIVPKHIFNPPINFNLLKISFRRYNGELYDFIGMDNVITLKMEYTE